MLNLKLFFNASLVVITSSELHVPSFFFCTLTRLKQKNTITSQVNVNVPGIQVKKDLNKEQRTKNGN